MEIENYSDIKTENIPQIVYKANAKFKSFSSMRSESYTIEGSYEPVTITGTKDNKHVGISFTTDTKSFLDILFIYHGDNPNKIFTTEPEAIAWSKKDLGYIH